MRGTIVAWVGPDRVMGPGAPARQNAGMRAQRGRTSRPSAPRALAGLLAGLCWLAIGAATGYLVVATPLLAGAVDLGLARNAASPVVGAAIWAAALTAPTAFVAIGLVRVAMAVERLRDRRRRRSIVVALAGSFPPNVTVIPRLELPDGRAIPDVVVGPHGIAFFEPLPPREVTRHRGGLWEARLADRSWRPIENPLVRAERDGDRLRRFLAADDRDFVVRVYPAVVGTRADVERTDACAVVDRATLVGWITALPPQRSLSPDRIAHLRGLLGAEDRAPQGGRPARA